MTKLLRNLALICVLSVFAHSIVHSQQMPPGERPQQTGVLHQYPLPGAVEESPTLDIGIRSTQRFSSDVLSKVQADATGSHSGVHAMTAELTESGDMLIFHPVKPFDYGERVTFTYSAPLAKGGNLQNTFSYATKIPLLPGERAPFIDEELASIPTKQSGIQPLDADPTLPKTFIAVDDHATPGEIYFANYAQGTGKPLFCHMMVFDEHGTLIRENPLLGGHVLDFHTQWDVNKPSAANNSVTYWNATTGKYYLVDTTLLNVRDSFQVADSKDSTDGHDMHLFPDGSYAILGVDTVTMDLTQYGGLANATVGGSLIEVFDPTRKLILRWRGLDHFLITDAVKVPLRAQPGVKKQSVDFQHANSIDFDAVGDIILSSRHLCEITKINGKSGNTVWHFGGKHNQFQLIGDSIWFSYQHDARWLPNGNLTLYDNSNVDSVSGRPSDDTVRQSRAVEYRLDTNAKTATLVWQFHHTPETYAFAMGSVQRLPNGNTLIGWGYDSITMTEVQVNTNKPVFEMTLTDHDFGYRATKVPYITAGVAASQAMHSSGLSLAIDPSSNANATIRYSLGNTGSVAIRIYDALGREVRLVRAGEEETSGDHTASLDLTELSAGTYYCVLRTPQGSVTTAFSQVR